MVHINDIKRNTDYHLARAEAIETYAQMEGALCSVFSVLLGITTEDGGIRILSPYWTRKIADYFRTLRAEARQQI